MSEHLIVFPDRDDADRIAEELRDEGFTEVRVGREERTDAPTDDGWALYVREEQVEDDTSAVGAGLRARFESLAEEHDGRYEPDPGSFRA